MKKNLLIFGLSVVAVGLLAIAFFAGASLVGAQGPDPETPSPWGGARGWMREQAGVMSGYMHAAAAERLDMTVEELQAQIDAGKTVWQIAEEKGLTADEIVTLMKDSRAEALDQMVADGTLTQEQADWMKQRGARMMGRAMGRLGCPMVGGVDGDAPQGFGGGMMRRGR